MDLRLAVVFLFLTIELTACARVSNYDKQQHFTIFVDAAGGEHTALKAELSNERTIGGIGKGASTGGIAGAASGLTCGPFALVCVPVFALGGSLVGGGVGATAGFAGLPENTAARLNEVLADIDKRRDFRQELLEKVVTLVPESDQASRDEADFLATIKISRIELNQHRNNEVSLLIKASLLTKQVKGQRLQSQGYGRALPQYYPCTVEKRDAEDWLKDDEDAFDQALTLCIKTISEHIAADLIKATGV